MVEEALTIVVGAEVAVEEGEVEEAPGEDLGTSRAARNLSMILIKMNTAF